MKKLMLCGFLFVAAIVLVAAAPNTTLARPGDVCGECDWHLDTNEKIVHNFPGGAGGGDWTCDPEGCHTSDASDACGGAAHSHTHPCSSAPIPEADEIEEFLVTVARGDTRGMQMFISRYPLTVTVNERRSAVQVHGCVSVLAHVPVTGAQLAVLEN